MEVGGGQNNDAGGKKREVGETKEEKNGEQCRKKSESRLVSTYFVVFESKNTSHDEPKNKRATRKRCTK